VATYSNAARITDYPNRAIFDDKKRFPSPHAVEVQAEPLPDLDADLLWLGTLLRFASAATMLVAIIAALAYVLG
jgi:hypothetical protein